MVVEGDALAGRALDLVDRMGHRRLHADADFIGEMTFVESLIAIIKSNAMVAELIVLPVIPVSENMHRRELAEASRKRVADALQLS